MRPLREIKIRTIVFHAKDAKSAEFLFPFLFNAGAEGVANFVTTRVRREFIHPLPPAGYSHLSQGESLLQQNITAPVDCPPETGGTSEAERVDVFHLSVQ